MTYPLIVNRRLAGALNIECISVRIVSYEGRKAKSRRAYNAASRDLNDVVSRKDEAGGGMVMRVLQCLLSAHIALTFVAGCSSHPEPIIDTKGVDMTVYEADLAECGQYAGQIDTKKGVAKGAAGGAVVGAATGAISGNVGQGAGYGGIWGATSSGLDADRDKQMVVKRCLRGRGYKVLN